MFLMKDERGLTLVEVTVSMVIMALAMTPLLMMFINGTQYYTGAGRQTQSLNLAQEQMEKILETGSENFKPTEDFTEYPGNPQYEYELKNEPFSGKAELKKIIVRVRSKDYPDQIVSLITLLARSN